MVGWGQGGSSLATSASGSSSWSHHCTAPSLHQHHLCGAPCPPPPPFAPPWQVAEFLHEAADISKEVQAGSGKLLKDFVVALEGNAKVGGAEALAGPGGGGVGCIWQAGTLHACCVSGPLWPSCTPGS